MTMVRQAFIAVLLGFWVVVCAAQGTEQEAAGESATQLDNEANDGSNAADDSLEENADEGVDAAAQRDATEAGAPDPDREIPELAPLDELFIPSLGLRADEEWDDMPVDF